MKPYIDWRLTERISAAGEYGEVEAMIVVGESRDSCLTADDGGLARHVIEDAAKRAGEFPSAVRYFPRANAAVIIARGRFIQEILTDENLAVANATDVDAIVFLLKIHLEKSRM